jgi:hypothetical protein
MIISAELKDSNGQTIGVIKVIPKEFKTGSKGYFGNAKLELDGKRYQTQIQMVEIGSKNKLEGE